MPKLSLFKGSLFGGKLFGGSLYTTGLAPPVETEALIVRVHKAARAVAADLTPEVPDERIYRRVLAEYVPDRDGVPAMIVCPTPGQGETSRRTLSKSEVTYPVTIILIDAANQSPQPEDESAISSEWRSAWRDVVGRALHGRPAGFPVEMRRVTPDPNAFLDMTAFELKNLWWSAVSIKVMCRQPLS